jgi:hypothetical protein
MLKTIHKHIKHAINIIRYKFRDVGTDAKRSGKWPAVEKHYKEQHPRCEICNGENTIQVHHIIPFSTDPSLELDPNHDNLISACLSLPYECHLKICHGNNWHTHCPDVRKYAAILQKDISKYDEIATLAKSKAVPNR